MGLKQDAERVKQAGSRYGDTILAHITRKEAALLKAMGGSGRRDPKTGLPHFDAGGLRGDEHAGNASGGYGGGGSGSSGGNEHIYDVNDATNFKNTIVENTRAIDPNAGRAAPYSTASELNAINSGDYSSAGRYADIGYDKAVTSETFTPASRWSRMWHALAGTAQAVQTVLQGSAGPLGFVSAALTAKKAAANLSIAIEGGTRTQTLADGSTQKVASTSDKPTSVNTSSKSNEERAVAAATTASTTSASTPSKTTTSASAFDYFTSLPRIPADWSSLYLNKE